MPRNLEFCPNPNICGGISNIRAVENSPQDQRRKTVRDALTTFQSNASFINICESACKMMGSQCIARRVDVRAMLARQARLLDQSQ